MTDGATPLDPDEMAGLIPTWLQNRDDLNEVEGYNILQGITWTSNTRPDLGQILTVEWLLELHGRLFGDVWTWAGSTRTTGKNIGVDVWEIRSSLVSLVADARLWLLDEEQPSSEVDLMDVARFHHRLVWIHAFTNGNGRHARAAVDVVLKRLGLPSAAWSGVDLVRIDEFRESYVRALRAGDAGDIGPLTTFMFPKA